MKIFNWVQKRFHHGALKEGLAQNVKKAESIKNDADKQALLKQVALVDVLDGWKGGILTIGTLGFDPLKPLNQQNEYFILESEEEDYDHEKEAQEGEKEEEKQEEYLVDDDDDEEDNAGDEEVNPLIFTRFDHRFEDIGSNSGFVKSEVIVTADCVTLPPIKTNYTRIPDNDQGKRKGERTTLAELFMADSDMKKKTGCGEMETNSGKKPVARSKNGLSFAKKLMPHVREDSRPIKKIHQLMRRMLKRKIHPELEGKDDQTENSNNPGIMEVRISKENEASESVSLLQTAPGPTI